MARPASNSLSSPRVQAALYYSRRKNRNRREAARPVLDTDEPPTISGDPTVGEQLSSDPGEWTGAPQFTYVWRRDADIIDGEVSNLYVLTEDDEGAMISVTVTARGPLGVRAATSEAVGPIAAA